MEIAHGFFEGRHPLSLSKLTGSGRAIKWAEYQNVPDVIATIISKKFATLHELETVYSARDAYDLLEISSIDDYNRNLQNQQE